MRKFGLVTLGQSPRTDIMPDMMMILGHEFEILEEGALDGQTLEDVKKQKIASDEPILVTRMRDGTEVKVTKKYIVPLVQERITELEKEGVDIILLLCTGKFPEFESKALIVTPSEIVKGTVNASIRKGKLGVVYPAKEQTKDAQRTWGNDELEVYADWASPYGSEAELWKLGERLNKKNLDLILLNCMGFRYKTKQLIASKTGKPVIQSNALVARVLKELV